MSPSSASSSDYLSVLSNTSSSPLSDAPSPQPASDILPMITTSHFESTLQDVVAVPQWSNLARSISSDHLRTVTGLDTLAVPASVHARIGSPSPAAAQNSVLDAMHAAFLLTRSRVVKVRKDPSATFLSLRSIFEFLDETSQTDTGSSSSSSVTVWTLKDLSAPHEVWVVFKSHREAHIFLTLSLPSFHIFPAIEADLDNLDNFRRLDLSSRFPALPVIQSDTKSHRLRMSVSTPDFHSRRIFVGHPRLDIPTSVPQSDKFVISTNPPNPRTTFRVGDWICTSVTCAAHNFGRNIACRGCGCPRSESQASSVNRQLLGMPSARPPTSPRFAGTSGTSSFYPSPSIPTPPLYSSIQQGPRYQMAAQSIPSAKSASPSHPLLTPSGRSFSVGGKVQNISNDPSMPCIMYWPDNEPFPEQGQIRPSNLTGVPQPPILNTGNRGPIEHQPGDWICQKCNYLNWRRRKVCQTCYPYAEGNGDSISAAVQSERINLLTSLLAQNQLPLRTSPVVFDAPRRNAVAQVQQQRPQDTIRPSSGFSRSQIDLRTATQYHDPQFIYETSGPQRHASPSSFPGMRELEDALPVGAPVPLLPSFLQDIVQSPTLSPASTSSADLSIEEYEDAAPSPRSGRERVVARDDSASNFPLGNIWRLNDEEATTIAGIALPHHEDLVGSRKNSQEILRRQSPL